MLFIADHANIIKGLENRDNCNKLIIKTLLKIKPMEKVFEEFLIKKSNMIHENVHPISTCYKIDKKNALGSGTFGTVHRVLHKKTG